MYNIINSRNRITPVMNIKTYHQFLLNFFYYSENPWRHNIYLVLRSLKHIHLKQRNSLFNTEVVTNNQSRSHFIVCTVVLNNE